ncbi:hypothetical protein RN001_001683 [Aquatica leii]|uniref:ATP synthase subunit b n=1 Tax=Aquatica leii TaxID=1421715 RepID=A0AAN7Q808_9COLE|nr:hypothetical protein RN001_001683 [Aquatica leii]
MLSTRIKLFIKDIRSYKEFSGINIVNKCCFSNNSCMKGDKKDEKIKLVRQEPGIVRLGFIPNEWFEFFFNKTGVTGLGTLCFTVGTFLFSKEYYVLEHEYYNGLSLGLLCGIATKYIGPDLAKFLDKEIDEYENELNQGREGEKKSIEECIQHEQKLQLSAEGQLILLEAKRENVALQREAAYRERCMHAYTETRKRLEFCITREAIEKAMAKRCMTDWVVEQVRVAISKEIEDSALSKCMEDLKHLTETFETLKTPYPEESIETFDPNSDKKK